MHIVDYEARPNSIHIPYSNLGHVNTQGMAASSTLSSLSRTPTPFSRYQTADEGASIRADLEDVTDISSPGEAADHDFGLKAPYRNARALPEELKHRCQIHIEEQTCEHYPLYICTVELCVPLNNY